jgi:hypothetical protein
MNQVIWIYDLGVKGDYEGLHAWLDDHDAENVVIVWHFCTMNIVDLLNSRMNCQGM